MEGFKRKGTSSIRGGLRGRAVQPPAKPPIPKPRRRKPWDSNVKDPSIYKLTPAEQLRRKELLVSKHNVLIFQPDSPPPQRPKPAAKKRAPAAATQLQRPNAATADKNPSNEITPPSWSVVAPKATVPNMEETGELRLMDIEAEIAAFRRRIDTLDVGSADGRAGVDAVGSHFGHDEASGDSAVENDDCFSNSWWDEVAPGAADGGGDSDVEALSSSVAPIPTAGPPEMDATAGFDASPAPAPVAAGSGFPNRRSFPAAAAVGAAATAVGAATVQAAVPLPPVLLSQLLLVVKHLSERLDAAEEQLSACAARNDALELQLHELGQQRRQEASPGCTASGPAAAVASLSASAAAAAGEFPAAAALEARRACSCQAVAAAAVASNFSSAEKAHNVKGVHNGGAGNLSPDAPPRGGEEGSEDRTPVPAHSGEACGEGLLTVERLAIRLDAPPALLWRPPPVGDDDVPAADLSGDSAAAAGDDGEIARLLFATGGNGGGGNGGDGGSTAGNRSKYRNAAWLSRAASPAEFDGGAFQNAAGDRNAWKACFPPATALAATAEWYSAAAAVGNRTAAAGDERSCRTVPTPTPVRSPPHPFAQCRLPVPTSHDGFRAGSGKENDGGNGGFWQGKSATAEHESGKRNGGGGVGGVGGGIGRPLGQWGAPSAPTGSFA
ncbi:unnamed protein product [Phaeothamnion confervicola]